MRRKLAFGRLANHRGGGGGVPGSLTPHVKLQRDLPHNAYVQARIRECPPYQHGTLAPILPLLWRKPRRREASFPEVTELGSKPRRLCPGVCVLTSVRFTQSWEKVSLLSVFYFTFSRGVYGFWDGNVSL